MATTNIKRSGWLGEELNDKPCTYRIPKDPEGDPRDTKRCDKPSVYKAVGGFEYCQEHAPEVAENDEIYIYLPSGDEEEEGQTQLEQIFENTNWEYKEIHTVPRQFNEVWREADADEARETLAELAGETNEVTRSLFLFEDSLGQALAYDEEELEED